MPGPSPRLEAVVGVFIPPACREEVLGDLREMYVSPVQYIGLAMRVVPCVILSRIRRTSDPLTRITEALLIYGSFLAATWFNNRSLLSKPEGFLWVAIPTAANLIDLTFADLWSGGSPWPARIVRGAAVVIGAWFNAIGECACILLVMCLHLLPGRRLHEASGPSIEADRKAAEMPAAAKSLLAAATAVVLLALFLTLTGKPHATGAMAAIVVFVVVIVFRNPRKD
jgi:hypothetical protein